MGLFLGLKMSMANLLRDVLGSKVKKASKIMDVGMDVGIGVIDAAKGAIKGAAISALKERANTMARDWMMQEYHLDVGKNGINSASLTRLVNAALANHGSGLEISNIGDVRAIRNEVTKHAVKLILEELGGESPSDLANRIIKLSREKLENEIDGMGPILEQFRPDPVAVRTLELYGEIKVQEPSKLPDEEAENNRERQRKYRAAHKGEPK